MTALTTLLSTHLPRPQHHGVIASLATRSVRRDREFGVGYGSSSGYATAARYAPQPAATRFRFG